MGATNGVDIPLAGGGAASTGYTPSTPANWSPPPTTVAGALDQAAARLKALESVPGATPEIYTCPMAAAVRQIIYKTGVANAADLADASNPAKMPVRGFITSKPTATSCIIQDRGELDGWSGLTPGAVYFADPAVPGGIITPAPAHVPGQVAQTVGFAKSTTVLDITLSVEPAVEL